MFQSLLLQRGFDRVHGNYTVTPASGVADQSPIGNINKSRHMLFFSMGVGRGPLRPQGLAEALTVQILK